MNNIFELPDPQNWGCKIVHVTDGHSILSIEMLNLKTKQRLMLGFRKVAFFSGWTTWIGANFTMKSDAELRKFAETKTKTLTHELEVHIAELNLYTCTPINKTAFEIIANAGWCQDMAGNLMSSMPRLTT